MYERFTDRARKVMQLANQEAQRFNHEYIGTEHILLGLVKEGTGTAAHVLKNLKVEHRMIRLEVEKIVQHGPGGEQVTTGRLPHTPRTKKSIEYAIMEARDLDHNYVGTEHLLLGLLREEEGVAAQVLINLGVKIGDVREELLNLLRHHPRDRRKEPEGPEPAPVTPDRLTDDEIKRVEERIERLNTEKERLVTAGDLAAAAKCRDEADALAHLVAWYRWYRDRP